MAHFRGTLQGQRGEASRRGDKRTGLVGTVNGWNHGIKVYARCVTKMVDGEEVEVDEFLVYETGGSNAARSERLIAKVGG